MRTARLILAFAIVLTAVALPLSLNHSSVEAQAEPTGKLAEVLERGRLVCGVSGTLAGFSFIDP